MQYPLADIRRYVRTAVRNGDNDIVRLHFSIVALSGTVYLMNPPENDPVTQPDDLLRFYRNCNTSEKLFIGLELERSGVYRESLQPVTNDGENGYQAVFKKLVDEAGWEVIEEKDGVMYELKRGDTRITTEGDGRPELSGSPKEFLHDLAREFRLHDNELREMGNIFNIAWLPVGFNPFHKSEDIELVENKRLGIIIESFKDPSWMKTLIKSPNSLHLNFSVIDEQNAIAKVQTAFRVLPIVGAMFASSPFHDGILSPYLDARRHFIVGEHKEGRMGIPEDILDPDFSYASWINFYIDIPVIFIKTATGGINPKNLTFRQWMKDGYEGLRPTAYDFDQHVKTVWSDVRLRQGYIEYRVSDSVPSDLALALPALMKGLLFDSRSWQVVEEMTRGWTYQDIIELDRLAWTEGLKTSFKGHSLLTYAQQLLILANEMLHGFERLDATESDESVYLKPLKEQIFIKEESPAEELRRLFHTDWNGDIARIVPWCEKG